MMIRPGLRIEALCRRDINSLRRAGRIGKPRLSLRIGEGSIRLEFIGDSGERVLGPGFRQAALVTRLIPDHPESVHFIIYRYSFFWEASMQYAASIHRPLVSPPRG